MIGLLCFTLAVLASPFKSKLRLEAENAALRHQLIVLPRKLRGRVRLANSDRMFFVQLYRWFPSILQVLAIIRPETLIHWHRSGSTSQNFTVCKRLAKAFGVGRQWTTLVPLDCKSFSNRLAVMRYANNSQLVAIRSQERCEDCHAFPSLRQCKQGVRCATLEQNIWLNVRKTAGCIEQPADGVA
jgi:hypothetical protein